ncbi:MAG: hypothetical protein RMA76_13745 [Deltaproteobacteria bacterium]|jgi:hypothetical protein
MTVSGMMTARFNVAVAEYRADDQDELQGHIERSRQIAEALTGAEKALQENADELSEVADAIAVVQARTAPALAGTGPIGATVGVAFHTVKTIFSVGAGAQRQLMQDVGRLRRGALARHRRYTLKG